MANVGSLVVRIGADVGGLEKALKGAQSSLQSFGAGLKSAGTTLTAGVTAPLVGVATAALASAAAFETSMNQMQATTGATDAQMAALEAQALSLGASTSFSAGEAAEAMLELAKAGMTVEQTSAAIGGVMDLAAAGGIDLASAATITANAINSFGLEASAATSVANTFAAAANASSADVQDLAAGFQMAGAVFAANGQSVEDLAAGLAVLANNGIAGSDAGTSLKTMMMRLAAPTDAAAAAMANLGLNVYDAQGAMLPFGEIIGQLEGATAGLDDAQRNAALSTIFGADAIRAATILAGEGAAGFDAMREAVGEQGAAASMAQARMAGLGGALEYFKGSIESLLIGAALPFMDTLSGMVRGAADLLSQLGTLTPAQQRFAAILAVVAAAAGPVLMVLGSMATALGALLSPLGLVVAAAAALGAAWATNFGGIREKTAAAWAAVQPVLATLATWLQGALPAAVAAAQGAFTGTLLPALQELWATAQALAAGLAAFFGPAVERLGAAFATVGVQIGAMMPQLQGIGTAFAELWTAVQPVLTAMGAALAVAADVVINLFAAAFTHMTGIVGPILDTLGASISALAQIIQGLTDLVVGVFTGDWPRAFAGVEQIVTAFAEFFTTLWENLGTLVESVAAVIYETFVNTLTDLNVDAQAVLNTLQGAWENVWNALKSPVEAVGEVLGDFWDSLTSFVDWVKGISIPNPFAGWSMPSLPNWMGGGGGAGNAVGTPSWPGGLTMVGEFGPELVALPAASRIWSNEDSEEMLGGRGAGVVIRNVTVNDRVDVEALAYRVAGMVARRQRI